MGREFTACRVSGDGNAIFPDKIIIDSLRKELVYRKSRLIGYKETRVGFDAIGLYRDKWRHADYRPGVHSQ